jgi:hypothetical protein
MGAVAYSFSFTEADLWRMTPERLLFWARQADRILREQAKGLRRG